MADSKITDLAALSVVALDDLVELVDISDTSMAASGTNVKLTIERLLGFVRPSICDGRLTTESTVPVSTSDRTGQTSVYFTPHIGNRICLYDGTRWKLYAFTELTLALGTLTSGLNYDVFIYDNAGTLTLEATAWTNDTTRATALTTQDGVYVKTGATTRRYLGTFRTTSTTTTEDSQTKRFVWNNYNSVRRQLFKDDATPSWTYSSSTIRQARGQSANKVEVVCGILGQSMLQLIAGCTVQGSNTAGLVGIGEDSTTTLADNVGAGNYPANGSGTLIGFSSGSMTKFVPLGYHYYAWLEMSAANGNTATFYGNDTGNLRRAGLVGSVEC